jgi:hypothetical protein
MEKAIWKIVQYSGDKVFKTRFGETRNGFDMSLKDAKMQEKSYTYKIFLGKLNWKEYLGGKPGTNNESLNESLENTPILDESFLNEYLQLGDTVRLNKEKGFIIGEIEGKLIIQVQGNTHLVDPKEVKEWAKKSDIAVQPHMKFDEKTQKLLFEQYIKCGIYHGNVPIKMSDCYVKYSSWERANPDQQIKVLVEGNNTFMPKSQVRILEDINDFANEDNYVPGVIVDELSDNALENVLINVIGDSDGVKIIKTTPSGEQEFQTLPKSSLKTLSV